MTRSGIIVRRAGVIPIRRHPREEKPANGNIPKRLSEAEKKRRDKGRKNLAVVRTMENMEETRERLRKEKKVFIPRVRKRDAKEFIRRRERLAA